MGLATGAASLGGCSAHGSVWYAEMSHMAHQGKSCLASLGCRQRPAARHTRFGENTILPFHLTVPRLNVPDQLRHVVCPSCSVESHEPGKQLKARCSRIHRIHSNCTPLCSGTQLPSGVCVENCGCDVSDDEPKWSESHSFGLTLLTTPFYGNPHTFFTRRASTMSNTHR